MVEDDLNAECIANSDKDSIGNDKTIEDAQKDKNFSFDESTCPEELKLPVKNTDKNDTNVAVQSIPVQKDDIKENVSYDKLKITEKNSIYQTCKKQLRDVLKTTKKGFFKKIVNPLKQFTTKMCNSVSNKFKSKKKIQIYDFKTGKLGPEAKKIIKDEFVSRITC